jgi:DNA-binding CsgD family transcriptional regulator
MADPREATWRFINLAPIMAGQAALDDLFAETLRPFGVDRFDCGRLAANSESEPRGLLSGRGLSAWNQYFVAQGYSAVDPCPQVYGRVSGAYTWTEAKALTDEAAQSPMWADAHAGGMREALIVPTAPRRPAAAIVRLVTPEKRFDPSVLPLLQSIAVIYAASTQSFSSSKSRASPKSAASGALTEREIECLHWAARGKTNPEIGVILNISRHTVNSHIESAKSKLGVATRVQAAAIAHRLGWLSIA